MKDHLLHILLFVAVITMATAQPLAPNAPKDKPVATTADQLSTFEKAIAPYIAKAKETYPEARARFIAGLPEKHHFFVTIRIKDSDGRFEQIFVQVLSLDEKKMMMVGRIASQLAVVRSYAPRQVITFAENEVMDWTISRPDGTEEGNYIGKFLDEYQKKTS